MPLNQQRPRWCGPCIAVGVVLFGYANVVMAQAAAHPVFEINVYALVSGLLGLLLVMCGTYVKGLYGRVDRVENQIGTQAAALAAHQISTAQNHPTKNDLDHKHTEVISQLDALQRRFDAAHYPSAFQHGREPRQ